MSESKLHCEECEPNTAGELLKSLRMLAGDWVNDNPANGSFHADGISEGIRGCGRTLQRLLGEHDAAAAADAPPAGGEARYALVEQMGHRATVAAVRETTFCGAPMLEVTDLKAGSVHLAAPQSLYEVTWLTEDQVRAQAKPWTARAITAADPWGTAESDLDDTDTDEDDTDEDEDDEGNDDEGKDIEAKAERAADWVEDRSCRHDRDTEFGPGAAGEQRDLAPEAGAHPWFGPAGAPAAPPVNPIEASARRAVGWPEDQPQQQPADGASTQAAQRMML
jgi:hypothetical protein